MVSIDVRQLRFFVLEAPVPSQEIRPRNLDTSAHRVSRRDFANRDMADGLHRRSRLEGHHRLAVLNERGVDINALPREVIPRET